MVKHGSKVFGNKVWLIGLVILSFAKFGSCAEDTATSGYTRFTPAYVTQVVTQFNGYAGVKLTSTTNSSEAYWVFIDPSLSLEGAKALTATALAAKSNGVVVSAIYWGAESGLTYSFQWSSWIIARRRLHTLYIE